LSKRILTAIALMIPVVALVLWAPAWLFALGVLPFALLTLWEFLELAARAGALPARWSAYAVALMVWLVAALAPQNLLAAILGGGLALFIASFIRRPALMEVFWAAAAAIFALLYVVMPYALLFDLRASRSGPWVLLLTLVLVWTGDTAAYFGGRAWGRHKLTPAISPGKTVEGALASLFATVALGHFLYAHWFGETLHSILFPVILNVAAQIGDLAESALKRSVGVKDSSAILPGHGGMLDRVDALLFAIPAAWYYWSLLTRGSF
jgi:phosphatidate cytidylyltransferase